MNLYEVTIKNPDTQVDDANVMINLDLVVAVEDFDDYVGVALSGGVYYEVTKQTFFAAIHAAGSGFFKFSDKGTVAEQAE